MTIDVFHLFKRECGYCPQNSGQSTYWYCKNCDGTTEGCATCVCKNRQPEPRKMPCRVCHGKGTVTSGMGHFPQLEEAYLTGIRQKRENGVSAKEAREAAFNGPLACWFSVATDGWEPILQWLLEGHVVILEIEEKLIPMSLRHWDGCFD